MDDYGQDCPNLATRYKWQEAVRRVRFGPRSKTREIALLLSLYGNKDGTRYFPGVARLAALVECSERTVRDALATLRELGLLERVWQGSRNGRPRGDEKPYKDDYNLTIPPDLADRVAMLPEDEIDREREERRREERRADNDRRRRKRQAAAAALAATAAGSSPDLTEPHASSGEDSRNLAEVVSGESWVPYQGKASGVTGETGDRNRGKLRPDIPGATSGNAAYPLIGPTHIPSHVSDHSDPVDPPDARAPGADHDHLVDSDSTHESQIGAFELVLGPLAEDERALARQMLARGEAMTAVAAALAKDRPPRRRRGPGLSSDHWPNGSRSDDAERAAPLGPTTLVPLDAKALRAYVVTEIGRTLTQAQEEALDAMLSEDELPPLPVIVSRVKALRRRRAA